MRLVVGGDHAGYRLKAVVVHALREWGHAVEDVGAHGPDPVDFPDIAWDVCTAVRAGRADRGLIVCGTGVGACIAANKVPGIRAALRHDALSAHQCVEHDDVNVLALGARVIGVAIAADLVRAFADAEFSGEERHVRRLAKVAAIERDGLDAAS